MAETTTDEKQKRQRKAYTQATARLRENRRAEFDNYLAEESEKLGVEYKRRLTPEEKARRQMAELLQQYPGLADEVSENGQAAQTPQTVEDSDESDSAQAI